MRLNLFLITTIIILMGIFSMNISNIQAVTQVTMPYEQAPKVVVDGTISAGEYLSSYSDPDTGIIVNWEHNETNMYIAPESPGTGWVAIGFGPIGTGMDGANMIIGYVDDSSGALVLEDNFGQGWSHYDDVSLGGSRDIVSAAGSQGEGKTVIEFVFPLDSGDSYDYPLAPGSTYGFFVAYHATEDDLVAYHTAYSESIDFYIEAPGIPPNVDFLYTPEGLTVEFTDQSSVQNATIKYRHWDFGDGTSPINTTDPIITHTFPEMGAYTVTLTVTDDQGGTGIASKKLMVPSREERFQLWMTQVAVVSAAIFLLSFFAVGIAARRMGGKEGK